MPPVNSHGSIDTVDYSNDRHITRVLEFGHNLVLDCLFKRDPFYVQLHPTEDDLNRDLNTADKVLDAGNRVNALIAYFVAAHHENPKRIRAFRFALLFRLRTQPNLFAQILATDPSLAKAYNHKCVTLLMCTNGDYALDPRADVFLLIIAILLRHGADPRAVCLNKHSARHLTNCKFNETLLHKYIRMWRETVSIMLFPEGYDLNGDALTYLAAPDAATKRYGGILLATEIVGMLLKSYEANDIPAVKKHVQQMLADSKRHDANKGVVFAAVCKRIEDYIDRRMATECIFAISSATGTLITEDSPAILRFSKQDGSYLLRKKIHGFLAAPLRITTLYDAHVAYHAEHIAVARIQPQPVVAVPDL